MPLDTSIARSIKPLQIQFRDLGADYNQLAQMRSAESQNQLAQQQMQERQQLAPLRLQEQQSRAAAAKIELDDVNEANTYVKSVMTEAANRSGGKAPTDPFVAAKQMMQHPNSQVQAAGLRLLESSQKLIAFENQRANEAAYEADQRGVGAPAAAPNAAAAALSDFAVKTKVLPSGVTGNEFLISGRPVSEEEYTRQRQAIMLPQPVNAMAGAAGNVNAMVKPISPLQDPAALLEEIKKGDQQFARGGTPAPGWKNKRELLVKAFEQSLKPGRGAGGRYLSLGAGRALDQDTGQIISEDRVPAAAAAPKIINIKGVPHTLNEEGNLEPLTVEGGAPVVAGKAAPKITTVKGVPYTINVETGRLEPVPIEGGVLPAAAAQPQAAPKIINIKGVPHIFNVDKGKLERVPVEGGAQPAVGKGGAVGGAVSKPKAPSGYRYDASGENLEPIPGGPADKVKEGAATEGERKAATLLQRLQFSEAQLTEALVNNPNAAKPGVFASAVAMLSTPLANSLTPEARQRVQSAQLDILDAALTLGTGAAYTREQLEGYRDAYFPQIGDKPNQIKDKQARLNNVISAARIAAGKAARLVPALPAPAAGGSSAISAADAILKKGK
jgi:hypothetical protein